MADLQPHVSLSVAQCLRHLISVPPSQLVAAMLRPGSSHTRLALDTLATHARNESALSSSLEFLIMSMTTTRHQEVVEHLFIWLWAPPLLSACLIRIQSASKVELLILYRLLLVALVAQPLPGENDDILGELMIAAMSHMEMSAMKEEGTINEGHDDAYSKKKMKTVQPTRLMVAASNVALAASLRREIPPPSSHLVRYCTLRAIWDIPKRPLMAPVMHYLSLLPDLNDLWQNVAPLLLEGVQWSKKAEGKLEVILLTIFFFDLSRKFYPCFTSYLSI